MYQTSDAATTSPTLSPAARALWAVLILATLYLCYFHNLGAIGLVGPDEPRYAWIARDMAETGDWVTPRLYGKPWFEKPPLYYWGAALGFKIFGVSEVAARLPSALGALLATLAMAWLARRVYGAETARWVLLLLPTTVGMIGFSHAAATDMPFAAMLTAAMVFAAKLLNVIQSPTSAQASHASLFSFPSLTSSTSFTSFCLGVFLGLATLAKGPAALILAGGGVLLWAGLTQRWRDAFRCLHPVAVASFCLTALPWYVLCARRNPDFFRVFIIEHNFKRFLTPEFQHIQPFWFYFPVLLAATFPWAIVFLGLIVTAVSKLLRSTSLNPEFLFLLCWALFPVAFFSISKSKLPGYILPAVPVLGIPMARMLVSQRNMEKNSVLASLVLSDLFSIVAFIAVFKNPSVLPDRYEDFKPILTLVLLDLVTVFSLLLVSRMFRSCPSVRDLGSQLGVVCFLLLILLLGDRRVLSMAETLDISAKRLAHSLPIYGASPTNLRLVGVRRATRYQLNFYLRADLQEWDGSVHPGEMLLGESISCARLKLGTSCKDLWGDMDKTDDWELLRISEPGLSGGLGGGAGGGSTGNSLEDGQARQEK